MISKTSDDGGRTVLGGELPENEPGSEGFLESSAPEQKNQSSILEQDMITYKELAETLRSQMAHLESVRQEMRSEDESHETGETEGIEPIIISPDNEIDPWADSNAASRSEAYQAASSSVNANLALIDAIIERGESSLYDGATANKIAYEKRLVEARENGEVVDDVSELQCPHHPKVRLEESDLGFSFSFGKRYACPVRPHKNEKGEIVPVTTAYHCSKCGLVYGYTINGQKQAANRVGDNGYKIPKNCRICGATVALEEILDE